MSEFNKRVALEFSKRRSREIFYRYLIDYGWSPREVNSMWEYVVLTRGVKS